MTNTENNIKTQRTTGTLRKITKQQHTQDTQIIINKTVAANIKLGLFLFLFYLSGIVGRVLSAAGVMKMLEDKHCTKWEVG